MGKVNLTKKTFCLILLLQNSLKMKWKFTTDKLSLMQNFASKIIPFSVLIHQSSNDRNGFKTWERSFKWSWTYVHILNSIWAWWFHNYCCKFSQLDLWKNFKKQLLWITKSKLNLKYVHMFSFIGSSFPKF